MTKELNNYIAELSALALRKHKKLMLEQALITPRLLLKRVFGKDTEMRTLLGTMREEIEKMKQAVDIDYAPVMINRYINVMKKQEKTIPAFYEKEDITFYELNSDFIAAFDLHLKTEANLCGNTVVRYMKCFKRITNMALAKEWMRKALFYVYKMGEDETDPVFLTYQELKTIMEKHFTVPRLALVRDIFVFASFTGLVFTAVSTQMRDNLVQDNSGAWWMRKGRVKMEHRCRVPSISNVPLLPVPLSILKKNEDHPVCMKKGLCLPVICNRQMNSYLEEITNLCGIKKNLTVHIARYSFTSAIALANNVSLPNVVKMLGHSSTRMI